MSSSPLSTLTKERSLPSPVYRCCLRPGCSEARFPRASPAVAPPTSTSGLPAVYCLRGVGILTFGISDSPLSYYRLFVVTGAVALQGPRAHVLDVLAAHRGYYVGVARPGVLSVVLGGLGRMIRMGVVEPQKPHVLLFGPLLELLYRERLDEKPPAALLLVRVLGPPHVHDDPDAATVYAHQRPGALFRIRLCGVLVDEVDVPRAYLERQATPPRSSRRGTCQPRRTRWWRRSPSLSPSRPEAPSRRRRRPRCR